MGERLIADAHYVERIWIFSSGYGKIDTKYNYMASFNHS